MTDSPIATRAPRRSRKARISGADDIPVQPVQNAPPQPKEVDVRTAGRPQFAYLCEERLQKLIGRAYDLLEKHGIVISHAAARAALIRAGAEETGDGKRLKLPMDLVRQSLAATPKSVTLCGKLEKYDISLPKADGGFIMRTGTGAHSYLDPDTGEYRKLQLADVASMARLASNLDQVGFIAHPFVNDVPEQTADIHALATLITHTPKHVWIQPYDTANIDYLMRIAALAAGGEDALRARPIASCIVTSFTPLEFKDMDIEALIAAGKHGLPVHACSLPTAGGTAPATAPASVLMATAEILAMVTLARLVGNGTAVIATPLLFALDLRTGRSLQASIEVMQSIAMAVQVMKQGLGLPTHSYGSGSDTPALDGQGMAERALMCRNTSTAGADILGGLGQLECATVFSPVQAVLDDELAAMQQRYLRTPAIDDESLAWEFISNVEAGGNFLANAHTLRHCRAAYSPRVFQSLARNSYDSLGGRNAQDNARDLALSLINGPAPDGLPDEETCRGIRAVAAAADDSILKR